MREFFFRTHMGVSNKINLGTVFSGIGAIEQAFIRLNIPHDIVFACDNGERAISIDYEAEFSKIRKMVSSSDKKEYVDHLYSSHSRQTNFVQKSYMANYKLPIDKF